VFTPRNLIIAGVVLIAIALAPSGHGLWWLFALLWVLPHAGTRRHGCSPRSRRRHGRHGRDLPQEQPVTAPEPDPTRDRHEAFPSR
jgi:hypothetical protein